MKLTLSDFLKYDDPPKKKLFDSSAESSMERLLGIVNNTQKADATSVKMPIPIEKKTLADNAPKQSYWDSKGNVRTDHSGTFDYKYNAKVDNAQREARDNQSAKELGELALRIVSDPIDVLLSSLEYAKGDINEGEFALSLLPFIGGGLFKASKSLDKIDDVIDTSKPTLKPLEEFFNPADGLISKLKESKINNRQFSFEDLHNYVTQHNISRSQIPTGYWSNKIDELIMDNPFSTNPFEVVEYLRGNENIIRQYTTIPDSPNGYNVSSAFDDMIDNGMMEEEMNEAYSAYQQSTYHQNIRSAETGDYFTDLANARINYFNPLPIKLLPPENLEALTNFSQTYANLFNQHLINKGINDYSIQAKFNGNGLGIKTINKDGGVIGGWTMGLNDKAIEKIISRDSSVPEFPRDSPDPYYEIPVITMQNTTNVGLPPNSGIYEQKWWDYFRDQTGVRHGAGKNSQTTNETYINQGRPELKGSHDIWEKKVKEGKAWNSRRGNDMNRYVDAISYGLLAPLLYKLLGETNGKEEKR